MSQKLTLDIVTPNGRIFSGEVDEVTAVGTEGEFGIFPGHAPFITTLTNGPLTAVTDGKPSYFCVCWGYAEVNDDKVIVLADSAEHSDDIDVARAMEAKVRAEEMLKHENEEHFAAAEAALERAAARIHVAERFGGGGKSTGQVDK